MRAWRNYVCKRRRYPEPGCVGDQTRSNSAAFPTKNDTNLRVAEEKKKVQKTRKSPENAKEKER